MNSIERRVSEGLRAYGDGLSMTMQDIDRLERSLELKEQASPTQRRGKFWQGALAACAVTVLALGALALRDDPGGETRPAGPPPVTLAQLEGIWRVADSNWLWRFGADGTVTLSSKPNLLTGVGTVRSFTVRPAPGGFIAENGPDDPEGCYVFWAATISARGLMRATETRQSPACPGALDPDVVWDFTRVSPVSVAGAATTPDPASQEPQPVTDPTFLTGTWLLRGTGTLLTVDSSANYALQDLGATDHPETGSVSVQPDGPITFTPHTAPACTAAYGPVTSTDTSMDTQLASGSCHRLAARSDAWIRLN